MKSKSFESKIGYVGRKNCLILYIPIAVAKELGLKLGQKIKATIFKNEKE